MKSPPESCPRHDNRISTGESAAARAVIERPRRVRTARRALCALSRAPRDSRPAAPRSPPPPAPRACLPRPHILARRKILLYT